MNWTGGKLKRHKHGGSGLINRQRAFFAKQRTKLQNGEPSASPLTTSIQPNKAFSNSIVPPIDAGPSQMEQKGLKASQAPRPADFGSRFNHDKSQDRTMQRQMRIEHRRASNKPLSDKHGFHRKTTNVYPISAERSQRSRPFTFGSQHDRQIIESGSDHRGFSRRRMPEPPGELEACRKRLLQQNDWLELAAVRPLQMRFSPQGTRQKFGKRRKLHGNKSHVVGDSRIRLPALDDDGFREAPLMSGALGGMPDRVHIRIGDGALATQTHRSNQSNHNQDADGRNLSPDSMLLDAEGEGKMQSPLLMSSQTQELRAESILTKVGGSAQNHLPSSLSNRSPLQSDPNDPNSDSQECRLSEGTEPASSESTAKGSPLPRFDFRSDHGVQNIASASASSKNLATGIRETDNAWRGWLAFSNGTSSSVISTVGTQSSQSENATDRRGQALQNIGRDNAVCETHVRSDDFGRTNHSSLDSSWVPLEQPDRSGRTSPMVSPERRNDEAWRRFVFEDATDYDLHALVYHQNASLSTQSRFPHASAWSVAALASNSSSVDTSARLFEPSGGGDLHRKGLEVEPSVSSEDFQLAAVSTHNNVSNSQFTEA